jgi:glycosyltransferase involved in cell wall biosynthesis
MKISICTVIKNRSKFTVTDKDLTDTEKQIIKTSTEHLKIHALNEGLPDFKTSADRIKEPFYPFKNCIETVKDSWSNYSSFSNHVEVEWVIVDFNSTDWPLNQWINDIWGVFKVININMEHFSKGVGLNIAIKEATGEVIFLIDADMLVGPTVFADGIGNALNGDFFFPVCFESLDPSYLSMYPVWSGFGNVVARKSLFERVGEWANTGTWGGGDGNYFLKCKTVCDNSGRKVVRRPYFDFIHQWHPTGMRHTYYKSKPLTRPKAENKCKSCP